MSSHHKDHLHSQSSIRRDAFIWESWNNILPIGKVSIFANIFCELWEDCCNLQLYESNLFIRTVFSVYYYRVLSCIGCHCNKFDVAHSLSNCAFFVYGGKFNSISMSTKVIVSFVPFGIIDFPLNLIARGTTLNDIILICNELISFRLYDEFFSLWTMTVWWIISSKVVVLMLQKRHWYILDIVFNTKYAITYEKSSTCFLHYPNQLKINNTYL